MFRSNVSSKFLYFVGKVFDENTGKVSTRVNGWQYFRWILHHSIIVIAIWSLTFTSLTHHYCHDESDLYITHHYSHEESVLCITHRYSSEVSAIYITHSSL